MANALMLGGGAPTLTLQSGALAALLDKEVKFDAISTAGAGMLIGLLYAAPKGTSPRQALENTREMGVHDSLYDLFPVNFKVFHKPGSLADVYRCGLQSLPRLVPGQDLASRLFADWMALMFAAWCPSDLSEKSLGLCDHAPWIDDVVDFDRLKSFPGEFYMNAYCIEDQTMTIFTKEQITPDHFRAALAFPFIYPPFKFNGKTYIEGSAIDTLCFEGLLKYRDERLRREKAGETRTQKLAALEPLRKCGRIRRPLIQEDHPRATLAVRRLGSVDHDPAGRDRQGRHRAVPAQAQSRMEAQPAQDQVRHS